MLIVAPLLSSLITLLAAWCTTGSRVRRRTGVVLGVTAMLPPWLLPSHPALFRAICSLVAFTNVMRVVDLAQVEWPFGRRVLHVISVVDSRRLARRAPRFEGLAALAFLGWAVLAAVAFEAITHGPHTGIVHWLVRWLAGVVGVYAAVAGLYRFLLVQYSALGWSTPPLHIAPARSRTVQELWGERWARPVSDWLAATFFRPWARRRRPLVGVFLAFLASASFHAYAIWVGLGFFAGLTMTAWTFAYFVAQAIVMSVEQVLGVRRWPMAAGHAWTVAWMLALAPMFVEPIARLLESDG
jgi:hypothetical protein